MAYYVTSNKPGPGLAGRDVTLVVFQNLVRWLPEFLDLMALYPQPVRHQPTVEYLPERRHSEGFRESHE